MSNLPIRRVVLYKHGVGYFEREAAIEGDASLSLSFKQREVSDVLKSLTVLDLHGGTVSAVSYDSTTPIEQLLAEIALSIPDSGSLVGLLPQLKGARAAVKPTGSVAVQGAILGIDTIETHTETGTTTQVRLSLLTDSADVRTFDLFDLELTLLDDGIKRDLDFYLKTQLASKKKDARAFTLFAQGEGKRTVRVSYVLEAPVWKATYRILLGEETPLSSGRGSPTPNEPRPPGSGPELQPLIQGWAVVDNTSDEDWTDVSLTLVAGLPVSFVHDLYTPRYIRRPVVEVKETTGVLPPLAESGVDIFETDSDNSEFELVVDDTTCAGRATPIAAPMMSVPAHAALGGGGGGRGGYGGGGSGGGDRQSAVSSVQAQTRERQVGDLFEYGIEKPVTVRRNQSALVPIVLKPFAGRSVLLYQKAARAENPMRCVEFENTTGLTLEGGPVTVLEQGSYVGEAMLDTLKPTEKRLVGYAVELAVRVLDNIKSYRQNVSRVVIKNGVMFTHYGQVSQTTYTFTSKSDKEQKLYLDHPRGNSQNGDWQLFDTPAPHEITEHFWRFKFILPNKSMTFVVKMQQPDSQMFYLGDISDTQVTAWVEGRFIDKQTETVLRDSFKIRHEIAAFEEKLRQLATEREQIHAEQKRIRDNLGSLGERASEKELRERFVRTLGQQEDRLEVIAKDVKQHQTDRDIAKARLNQTLTALEFETAVPE
ncbi:MAG: hypothetical protein K8U57_22415 [Planctomycetes bacterium]|nr:hypothetical protein [Planctomycetota bacterium]